MFQQNTQSDLWASASTKAYSLIGSLYEAQKRGNPHMEIQFAQLWGVTFYLIGD